MPESDLREFKRLLIEAYSYDLIDTATVQRCFRMFRLENL